MMNPELKDMLVEPYKIVLSLLNLTDQNKFKWFTSDAFPEWTKGSKYHFDKGMHDLRQLLLANDILVISQGGKFIVVHDKEIISEPICHSISGSMVAADANKDTIH
ncbi:MAG: hypothetical protein KAR06_02375 [Deltaproteobacteria bacterium]|nr:hypothetical protein [Deltaproteobacteria bacterium]